MNPFALWGKTQRKDGVVVAVHPLICHMIDVAEVAGALWDRSLGGGLRTSIASALGCGQEDARRTLMYWAALHDVGKASPPFQRRYPPAVGLLEGEGLSFRRQFGFSDQGAWHGLITARTLPPLLESRGMEHDLAKDLARGLGGHHGTWPTSLELREIKTDHLGDPSWDAARGLLVDVLSGLYQAVNPAEALSKRAQRQALVALLSGLTSVADWLGSMERYFCPCPEASEPSVYRTRAARRAAQAAEAEGWGAWRAPDSEALFGTLFPGWAPNDMQRQAVSLATGQTDPLLVLIEAPTGSGKTEAALHLADTLAAQQGQSGLYIAMPTTATSNAMHARLVSMLDARYGRGAVSPLLVHSQALWHRDPPQVTSEHEADAVSGVDEMSWFLPRKRSLLAPFGVGTVDQALLSVLLTRHFFVRLFGLAHKTVIFDEIHAYDTYMSTLFQRLLSWLKAEGTSVIMLSATLPHSTRRSLLASWGVTEAEPVEDYPAITYARGEQQGMLFPAAGQDRTVRLASLERSPDALVLALRQELSSGGCAAVLCNTVGRAQDVYRHLLQAKLVPEDDLTLFHARFPLAWRERIEADVLRRYGKSSLPKERRGIVVATQVIEQSLDLDFDLMVTDLAPVDLVLQRAGRLHRHERPRPAGLEEPQLYVVQPETLGDLPAWGNDRYVYEPYMLLRTWMVLRGRDALHLPSETRNLIEAVYGPEGAVPEGMLHDALERYRREWEHTTRREQGEASRRLVLGPGSFRLFAQENHGLVEEDPTVHAAFQALTRWGSPGLMVVMLEERDGELYPVTGGDPVQLETEPDAEATRELVASSLSITHRGLVHSLTSQAPPKGWRRHPLLRYQRPLLLRGGTNAVEGTALVVTLNRDLGVTIARGDEQGSSE